MKIVRILALAVIATAAIPFGAQAQQRVIIEDGVTTGVVGAPVIGIPETQRPRFRQYIVEEQVPSPPLWPDDPARRAELDVFLDLGPQPLANALPATHADFADERTFPLDLAFCTSCTLVQLVDVIDPEVLFGHYLYVTGTSATKCSPSGRF